MKILDPSLIADCSKYQNNIKYNVTYIYSLSFSTWSTAIKMNSSNLIFWYMPGAPKKRCCCCFLLHFCLPIPGAPPPQKKGTVDTVDLSGLDQQLSFFTLLDRAYFPHYNNTKIIKFGWELFILWVISYRTVIFGICHWFVINRASELCKSGKSRKWQSIRNYS